MKNILILILLLAIIACGKNEISSSKLETASQKKSREAQQNYSRLHHVKCRYHYNWYWNYRLYSWVAPVKPYKVCHR